MSELAKRLREYRVGCGLHCEACDKNEPLYECLEAAARIEALERENERLREALKPFARESDGFGIQADYIQIVVRVSDCDRASALLGDATP